jgi:sucrose-6-phosphate hydrolase SacC (GH32 family)
VSKESIVQLDLKSSAANAQPISISFGPTELAVMDTKVPLPEGAQKMSLRIFLDRSVMEVFANGTVCVTRVIPPLDNNATLEINAIKGPATAKLIRAWPMQTIW